MSRATPEAAVSLGVGAAENEAGSSIVSDFMALTKARLSLLVIVTTFVGFCMASGPRLDWLLLFHAVIGTTFAAFSAAVLNQVMEAKVDRLMERTRHRPLPAGRMKPAQALWVGVSLAIAGVAWLWVTTYAVSTWLAAATIFIYIALYTPLKRRTSLCTIVGAIAGAIPPVIGWTAVRPSFDAGAWILFGILFTWQMPHFLAIAWMYRDEYAQAGFVMLPAHDLSGCTTAMQSLIYTAGLVIFTLVPFFIGLNTAIYLAGAVVLDVIIFLCAIQFLLQRTRTSARRLFFASILFLPLVLGLMIFTKA